MIKEILLSVIALIIGIVIGAMSGIYVTFKAMVDRLARYRELSEKHLNIMEIFKEWFIFLDSGKTMEKYFHHHNYKTIAVYGVGFLGECLVRQLIKTDVRILYIIDQKADNTCLGIPIRKLAEPLDKVDAIVVTPVYYFYSIKKQLSEKTDADIISIEEIFNEE